MSVIRVLAAKIETATIRSIQAKYPFGLTPITPLLKATPENAMYSCKMHDNIPTKYNKVTLFKA